MCVHRVAFLLRLLRRTHCPKLPTVLAQISGPARSFLRKCLLLQGCTHFSTQRELNMDKRGEAGRLTTDKSEIVTICATVNSGFEHVANQECLEKLGSNSNSRTVKKFRGRILFDLPYHDVEQATVLRSVDNLSVVVCHIKDVDLAQEKGKALDDLCQKLFDSDWGLALETWQVFTKSDFCLDRLEGAIYPPVPKSSGGQESGAKDETNNDTPHTENVIPKGKSAAQSVTSKDENAVQTKTGSIALKDESVNLVAQDDVSEKTTGAKRPTFRVTCTRTGEKHKFSSRDAAPLVGSLVNETFGWPVKMKEFDIEVVVNVLEDSILVALSLTRESLHRRNITHFGITTLKSTIAYCMLRMAQPQPGEVICDPMCGVGAIPLEGLVDWKSCYVIAGDVNNVAVERTKANIDSMAERRRTKQLDRPDLENDVCQWDVTNLPLRSSCIDVFVTDLPFGKRMGNRKNNWSLYSRCLEEMARVCPAGTGRAVLLTQDKKCMVHTLQRCSHLWKKKNFVFINHGGLRACVYLLQRAKVKNRVKGDAQGGQGAEGGEEEEDSEEEEGGSVRMEKEGEDGRLDKEQS